MPLKKLMNKLGPVQAKAGRGNSRVVKLYPTGKLSLLIIDDIDKQDFMASVSSYELVRWSKDKVVLQANPSDKFNVKLSDCPEKAGQAWGRKYKKASECFGIGSELTSIKDLPKYLGLCLALDAEIAKILSE